MIDSRTDERVWPKFSKEEKNGVIHYETLFRILVNDMKESKYFLFMLRYLINSEYEGDPDARFKKNAIRSKVELEKRYQYAGFKKFMNYDNPPRMVWLDECQDYEYEK